MLIWFLVWCGFISTVSYAMTIIYIYIYIFIYLIYDVVVGRSDEILCPMQLPFHHCSKMIFIFVFLLTNLQCQCSVVFFFFSFFCRQFIHGGETMVEETKIEKESNITLFLGWGCAKYPLNLPTHPTRTRPTCPVRVIKLGDLGWAG